MSVKIMVSLVTASGNETLVQVGGNWFDIGDAASDINGGDFWEDARKACPPNAVIKDIRIVPDDPIEIDD